MSKIEKPQRKHEIRCSTQNGCLVVDVEDLLYGLDDDAMRLFAQTAIFEERVMAGIVSALVEGGMWEDWWWIGGGFMDRLRYKLAPQMPEILQELLTHIIQERDNAQAEADMYRQFLWYMVQAWNGAKDKRIDIDHEWVYERRSEPNPAEVKAHILKFLGDHPLPEEWQSVLEGKS